MGKDEYGKNLDYDLLEDKYLGQGQRRDSKSLKQGRPLHSLRDRRSSGGTISSLDAVAQQPNLERTSEFFVKEVVGKDCHSKPDSDDQLVNLVKELSIKSPHEVLIVSKNVLFYGWFFGQTCSDSLNKLGVDYLKESLEIPQFQRWAESFAHTKGTHDISSIYKNIVNSVLHVTAKFTGREACFPYANQVSTINGKEFTIAIVGMFFTEKTFGLRVKLSEDQLKIFDVERNHIVGRRYSYGGSVHSSGSPARKTTVTSGKTDKKYPGLSFLAQHENFQPTDTRAHVTLAYNSGVKRKQTGKDLLDIIDMEARESAPTHDYRLPSGTLRQFGRHGDYVFVIYPKNRVLVKGVFFPFY